MNQVFRVTSESGESVTSESVASESVTAVIFQICTLRQKWYPLVTIKWFQYFCTIR